MRLTHDRKALCHCSIKKVNKADIIARLLIRICDTRKESRCVGDYEWDESPTAFHYLTWIPCSKRYRGCMTTHDRITSPDRMLYSFLASHASITHRGMITAVHKRDNRGGLALAVRQTHKNLMGSIQSRLRTH